MRIGEQWRTAVSSLVGAGIEADEARLEAEVLLRHVLGIDRAGFLARRNDDLSPEAAARLSALLQRRLAREPLAYITGQREFYGLDFFVDRRVLIPRPETEGLVERALARVPNSAQSSELWPVIADVGTGSGCIAVALAVHLPAACILATDVSAEALALAQQNARRHGVDRRITFLHGDLLDPLTEKVDVIVSNPPYIASAQLEGLQAEISRYEPRAALDGGPDGLDVIRRLLGQAPGRINPGGLLGIEIGDGLGREAARLARAAFPGAIVCVENDLAGLERYLIIEDRQAV
jgi:release factor glutamine methyltransferase